MGTEDVSSKEDKDVEWDKTKALDLRIDLNHLLHYVGERC